MKVAVAQFYMNVEAPDRNLRRMNELSAEAARQGAALIIFPEISNTGYDLKLFQGKTFPKEVDAIANIQTIAMQNSITVMTGLAIQNSQGNAENISALVGPHGCLLRYSKTHLFDMRQARESDLFHKGSKAVLLPWSGFTIAPLICFDLRFPELARSYALKGADLFLASSAWPLERKEVFRTLFRARAIENQAYMLSSNFVGRNPTGGGFAGCSAIVAPNGDLLAELDDNSEGIACAEIEPAIVASTREALACFSKRRVDIY